MFYSQFILAKKGPLGTIWIAAHLERKLRKNQVADTDIGVSVDSILFPEVPIALRLSSHLLLGVVRIYSRKVNYLFDDCSEALLKMKQAFRSTAVDLPPEESTAPYHSITLPETFDLDDFELPDNDIFQGNYVDHHISTREQITLQDTMEGVVYSTSQFGLDERFGDGDTSQVGLELEEDLFVDKAAVPGLHEVSEDHPGASMEPLEHLKGDSSHDRMTGSLEALPGNTTKTKIQNLAAISEFIDYAQAPSTPGLVEEPNVSSVKGRLVCDDHFEIEDHNLSESQRVECTQVIEENGCNDLGINEAQSQENLPSTVVTMECLPADENIGALDGAYDIEDMNNVRASTIDPSVTSIEKTDGKFEELTEVRLHKSDGVEVTDNMEEAHSCRKALISDSLCPEDPEILNDHVVNGETANYKGALRACNSHLSQTDTSSRVLDNHLLPSGLPSEGFASCLLEESRREEAVHASGTSSKVQGEECLMTRDIQSEEHRILEPSSDGEVQECARKPDDRWENANSTGYQSENLNAFVASDLPAPEKLLSVPHTLLDKPDDLLVESTPEKEIVGGDGSGAETKMSGRKRSFTESSLTVQSLNSIESFGETRSKRTTDTIPDDDDLLSSILVGRRSTVLKMKPTPPAPEAAPVKRVRTASRNSALKRKVHMDDIMVLHGDTIRQQLTNTEDIRRLRKKAPCTHSEILMIQVQFLEEEVFSEAVLTGMSAELTCLHGKTFDSSGIMISKDETNSSLEMAKNGECNEEPFAQRNNEVEFGTEPASCRNDGGQRAELSIQTENRMGEDHQLSSCDTSNKRLMNFVTKENDHRSSEHEPSVEVTNMETDGGIVEVADTSNHFETSEAQLYSGETCYNSNLSSDKMDAQPVEEVVFSGHTSNAKDLDGLQVADHLTETEFREGEDILLEKSIVKASCEDSADPLANGSIPTDNADAQLPNMSSETGSCINLTSLCTNNPHENVENEKLEIVNEDGSLAVNLGHDDKEQMSNHVCDEENKVYYTHAAGLDGDLKSDCLNDVEYPVCQEANQQGSMHTETTSLDHHALENCGVQDFQEFPDLPFGNDTEFLNVDDDEIGEEDDDGMPGAEDTQLLDNSGWSSRTRAVAKYLQILFDKEAGDGRKVLSMNNLLAGKTRKEASRMFFETLVLKTRDYINVEQSKPFDNINIKPRAKLMKSDF